MSTSPDFQIGRSQRIHSHGLTIRVYQIVGTTRVVWDANRDMSPPEHQYDSQAGAEDAADDSVLASGHVCGAGCSTWRELNR